MVVLTSTVDPPTLPAAVVTTAMSMARKSALGGGSRSTETLDAVRADLIHEAAQECERYLQRMLFPGDGTGERVCVAVVELLDRGEQDIPACPTLPDTSGVDVAITSVEKWDDAAASYATASYAARPAGRIRVDEAGVYRITASLTPSAEIPTWAITAAGRLFSWRDQFRTGQEGADAQPMPASGGMLKSGAASVLRMHRRQWTT